MDAKPIGIHDVPMNNGHFPCLTISKTTATSQAPPCHAVAERDLQPSAISLIRRLRDRNLSMLIQVGLKLLHVTTAVCLVFFAAKFLGGSFVHVTPL